MNKIITISFVAIIAITTTGLFSLQTIHSTLKEVDKYKIMLQKTYSIEKCALYDGIEHKEQVIANGLYWQDHYYYCVWAEGRTEEQIKKTEMHEYCHYLVNIDYEHFCEVGQ